ncbi:Fur family transcriptional regulator [Xanthovirga aplysinae]|uniref:Fur family transcriptional regulator n=1 Tax=Xanthovirga aplysinae TaxID=2529853 RepID=UPI0012BC54B7|nr:transcriptional repressor [Xanthovirga aplysinae]MTI30567.1 transcriptional repressor [Xanthovirga aplysinae]
MIDKKALAEQAKIEFEAYLKIKGLRKTAERFSIIDEFFALEEHVDVESFYLMMRNRNYSISRATIYNTLDLLVECGLAVKHQFREKQALYEQALTYKHHDHLVCNTCGKIKEFSDERIEAIKRTIGKELGSNIRRHALVFYGDCTIENCENKPGR